MPDMDISIIGTGYVGLVSGVCLAEKGHRVICVDMDPVKIEQINRGIPPIYERGLETLLRKNIGKNLRAQADLTEAVCATQLSIIAVGTPFDGDNIDLSYIKAAAAEIGTVLRNKNGYHVIVVKSTVVPGTTDEVVRAVVEEASGKRAGSAFGLGMNPEFLREGDAVEDFMNPDRIVMGGIDERSIDCLAELYRPFTDVDKIRTSCKTAEMIKYTANSLLATMISFSNEIGNLCTALGDIDVVEVMRGVHLDKRLSPILSDGQRITPVFTTYLEAGCGFGGSCFPKDVKALIAHGRHVGQPMSLLDAAIRVNRSQPDQILNILRENFASLKGLRVAILGLAFKPNTDDMRESPAIPVIQGLQAEGADIRAFDPVARHEAQKLFGDAQISYHDTLASVVDDVDAVVLLTRWEEFSRVPEMIAGKKIQPLVVDGRRMLEKNTVQRYAGIGYREKAA